MEEPLSQRVIRNKQNKLVVTKADSLCKNMMQQDYIMILDWRTKKRVLKSWAVPKGISFDPKIKRMAVLTEDHPVDYLLFEGVIPAGSYGAGTVIVWDTCTYTTEEEISDQFKKGKITFSLFGQKLRGKFKLIRIRSREEEENQWLLMKLSDGLESEEDLTINRPESVLIARTNDVLKLGVRNEDSKERRGKNSSLANASKMSSAKRIENTTKNHAYENQMTYANNIIKINDQQQEEYPAKVKPMLSTLVDKPFDSKDWVFEVKWDGVRSILLFHKSKRILELQSRNSKSITHRYPELIKALSFSMPSSSSIIKCKESVVLDGEIVVLDKKKGIPSFQSHQKRMNIDFIKEIENLSNEIPATYYFFDILYLDGNNLQGLPFLERRKILSQVIIKRMHE